MSLLHGRITSVVPTPHTVFSSFKGGVRFWQKGVNAPLNEALSISELVHPSPPCQMFDNISRLRFAQGPSGEPIADAMISAEGEVMEYRKGVLAEGKVEDWMTAVLNEMRSTNRLITKEAIFHYCHGKTRCVCVWGVMLTFNSNYMCVTCLTDNRLLY